MCSSAGNLKTFYSDITIGLDQDSGLQNTFTSCKKAIDVESFHVKSEEPPAGMLPNQW